MLYTLRKWDKLGPEYQRGPFFNKHFSLIYLGNKLEFAIRMVKKHYHPVIITVNRKIVSE